MVNKRIGILFGGTSPEHSVSIKSAKNILKALENGYYDIVPVGITTCGVWVEPDKTQTFLSSGYDSLTLDYLKNSDGDKNTTNIKTSIVNIIAGENLDAVFPVLHGTYGEDGSIQGLCKILDIPCVGSGIASSAICLDKEITKRVLRDAGISVANFVALNRYSDINLDEILKNLGKTVFVKPSNLGSSIGISKASNAKELKNAIETAFQYDNKIIIEAFIKGRELECAILGNENLEISDIGEISYSSDYYDYNEKYSLSSSVKLHIPASVDSETKDKLRNISERVYRLLSCQGMARVDFFLSEKNEIYVNEVNTIPGFTNTSMYPKLIEATGHSYAEIVKNLIELSFEGHRKNAMSHSVE